MPFLTPTFLTTFVLSFLAYVISITISGSLQAHIVQQVGDTTAIRRGYGEFNPTYFIEPLALFIFIAMIDFLGVGFMPRRAIPIHTAAIQGKGRILKRAMAFFSPTLIHLIIGAISLIGIHLLFASSLSVLILFLQICARVNVLLALFSTVQQGVQWYIAARLEQDNKFARYAPILLTFLPLVILFFCGGYLYSIFAWSIQILACSLLSICGKL